MSKLPPTGFDDPEDRGQKKLPLAEDFKAFITGDVQPFNRKFGKAVQDFLNTHRQIDNELKAFMLHGFIAATDLPPNRCTLVTRNDGGTVSYTFVESDLFEKHNARIVELEALVDELRQENRALRRR